MCMKNDEVLNDKTFQKFLQKKQNLKQDSVQNYVTSLRYYCEANNFTLTELVREQHHEQRNRIKDGIIIEYNPDFGSIDDYQYQYISYLQSKGNKNISIRGHLIRVNGVLKNLGVKVPTFPDFVDDTADWYVLTKEEIKYVLNFASPKYRAMILLMCSTGMRRTDILNLKIKDYMKYTYTYHECNELDDFLANATDDMMAFFDYYPQKTQKHKIQQKVFNSFESNQAIIFMLNERMKLLERRNERTGEGITMSKEDYLFSSPQSQYKGRCENGTVTLQFNRFNKKLVQERKTILDNKLKKGDISRDTYHQLLEETPVFNAHALRKYFITQVAMNCTNPRAISLLEGHTTLLRTDINYVDSRSIEEVIHDEYLKILPHVSFADVDIDLTILKRNKDLLEQNKKQEALLKEQALKFEKMELENEELKTKVNATANKVNTMDRILNKYLNKKHDVY